MNKSVRTLFAGATLLASAVPMIAGGLFVMLGNPDADPQARALGAVVTLRLAGCGEPEKADVSAVAIGAVAGKRQTIPLKLSKLSQPGAYAVTRQWPAEGRWVLQFIARDGQRLTSTLVAAGPNGVERNGARMAMRMPAETDIAELLAGPPKPDHGAKMNVITARLPRFAVMSSGPAEGSGDAGFVRAAADGDRAAFEALYERYARMVHGILLVRVKPADAEDLVQDVFLSAYRKLSGLRSPEAFGGWLAAIARNRATQYHRDLRTEELAQRGAAPAMFTDSQNGAFEVLDIIRKLPEAYRETLILRLVEGMTGPEIAERTGLTPDSVRVNLCRGIKLLREQFGRGVSR